MSAMPRFLNVYLDGITIFNVLRVRGESFSLLRVLQQQPNRNGVFYFFFFDFTVQYRIWLAKLLEYYRHLLVKSELEWRQKKKKNQTCH